MHTQTPPLEPELRPLTPPLGVHQELNELFNKIQPFALRARDIAGEFGFTHVMRAKDGCQIFVTDDSCEVTVKRS
jgi:hypothetical protein